MVQRFIRGGRGRPPKFTQARLRQQTNVLIVALADYCLGLAAGFDVVQGLGVQVGLSFRCASGDLH
jgi:hypothetical protein